MKRHIYTEVEKAKIEKLYPYHPTKVIAKLIGVPEHSIYGIAAKLGLKKTPEYLKRMQCELAQRLENSGSRHRFTKGHVPANKGKKMSAEVYAKCSASMFKKGHSPIQTKYDGAESIRNDKKGHQYFWVRQSPAKWVMKHVLLWIQTHGSIPDGYNIVFKDGNTLNCVLENLECISDAELMQRNTLHNLPDDVKELVYLKGRLTRVINQTTKKQES